MMFDRILNMFTTVSNEAHGSVFVVFMIGLVFGVLIQYSRVDKFEKIAGFAMLRDTVVPKMLFLAIGLASIGLYFMVEAGYASYHPKPIILGGLVIGGTIFGISMAILGKCPGTGPVSIAEGRIDVLVGAIGGIFGGLVFTLYYDFFKSIMGESLGKTTLVSYFNGHENLSVFVFGIILIIVSIVIPLRQEFDEADLQQLKES
ncbi:YeeE/YedE family protein [Sulfurimonas sp. SWIR-19]|uniref:YeeE/YedE thiosulfate transporter family protein n=1 Tax=Sulfurimonas sp. SWIR-19 TaxID=2878390 RepID=UPI001CF266E2|nr:YeeE/YedE thiosulfate transporter family protein [Sulfurimonas sp. SWIR-19]UCN00112.1 YeeE/YedE family protein [Sulfurimonas sp. SWIR-19]